MCTDPATCPECPPEPARAACPECKGTGQIPGFTHVLPCLLCAWHSLVSHYTHCSDHDMRSGEAFMAAQSDLGISDAVAADYSQITSDEWRATWASYTQIREDGTLC